MLERERKSTKKSTRGNCDVKAGSRNYIICDIGGLSIFHIWWYSERNIVGINYVFLDISDNIRFF